MAFYHPRAIDPHGGFYHFFKDDGTVYDTRTRHLVSSARFVFNYAVAWRRFQRSEYLQAVHHGLRFLRTAHRNPKTGGYAWLLEGMVVRDPTNHCYGLAFVLLAYAHALQAGVGEARADLEATFALMERRFWSPAAGLYADEASGDWSELSAYRGQNANMHACEAMLAAFDATGDVHYLERAETLAHNITLRQAKLASGLIWEHYRADWSVDWDYNRNDKTNIFRPWGYQPGHLTEWAKLLLILERHRALLASGGGWLLPRAVELFDAAMRHAWDEESAAGSITDSRRTRASATTTSISGCRLNRLQPPRCSPLEPEKHAIGTGMTESGGTVGSTSSITAMARGTGFFRATIANTATRRVPPGRPTTTQWGRATKS